MRMPTAAMAAEPRPGSVEDLLSDLFLGESFDHVALLEIVEIRDAGAALEARLDLCGVVLEALERIQAAREDDNVVSQQPHFAVPHQRAVLDVQPGDGS